MSYVCIVCGSTRGAPSPYSRAVDNWHFINPNPRYGPFCSFSCVDRWKGRSPDERAHWAFGSVARAGNAEQYRKEFEPTTTVAFLEIEGGVLKGIRE